MPPPLLPPPRPPLLFVRPWQIAFGVLVGWVLHKRHHPDKAVVR